MTACRARFTVDSSDPSTGKRHMNGLVVRIPPEGDFDRKALPGSIVIVLLFLLCHDFDLRIILGTITLEISDGIGGAQLTSYRAQPSFSTCEACWTGPTRKDGNRQAVEIRSFGAMTGGIRPRSAPDRPDGAAARRRSTGFLRVAATRAHLAGRSLRCFRTSAVCSKRRARRRPALLMG